MNQDIIKSLRKSINLKENEQRLDKLFEAYEKLESKKINCSKNQLLAINFIDNWNDAIQHDYFPGSELNDDRFVNMAKEIIEALENNKEITNKSILEMCSK